MTPRAPAEYAEIPPMRTVKLPPAERVDLDATQPEIPSGNSANRPDAVPSGAPPATETLRTLHQEGLVDFVNQKGWGYVRDLDHVAGFQSHHFRRVPQLRPTGPEETWTIRRLELVSLLAFDEPRVYDASELPRMDELAEVSTRPLDRFEEHALEAIRESEELVVESSINQLHMVGAIRAADACMKCHQVRRGDLLGAFSYTLERDPSLHVKKAPAEPVF